MKSFVVFNAEQCRDLDRFHVDDAPVSTSTFERHEQAEELIRASNCTFNFTGSTAFYSPQTDEITMPRRENFESPEAFYETALHELCHHAESRTGFDRSNNSHGFGELCAEMFDAVLSRCLVYRMDMSNSEIIEQFRVMSADGYPGCPSESAAEIVDFIEEHGSDKQLSMRLLTPAVRIFKFCNEQNVDWRPVLLAQLQTLSRPATPIKRLANTERDERIVREALRRFPDSTTDACRYYIEKSSKSRASFYRSLKRVKQMDI